MEVEASPVAYKVLLQHIFTARQVGQSLQTEAGLPLERVWVQGTARAKLGSTVTIDDGTAGNINVLASTAAPGIDTAVSPGDYLLVIGKLVARGADKSLWHIKAHKLINFSTGDPEGVSQRMLHWSSEVAELHRNIYPGLAAAAGAGGAGAAAAGAGSAVCAALPV